MDITALLPCDEEDFAMGRLPQSRAALHDTPSARDNPNLISDKNRSLFASLMQVHHFWGYVGRRAIGSAYTARPWDNISEFSTMLDRLKGWEGGLPLEHQWSPAMLKRHKAEGVDLVSLFEPSQTLLLMQLGISWRDYDAPRLPYSPSATLPRRVSSSTCLLCTQD